jgi:hypothetical protein
MKFKRCGQRARVGGRRENIEERALQIWIRRCRGGERVNFESLRRRGNRSQCRAQRGGRGLVEDFIKA